jgi:triosephosphate isomerase
MLADAGVKYVILGHSERRRYLGETDEIINLKLKAVLKAKLKPIICIGEKEGEGIESVVENQLTKILVNIPESQLKNIIITYEPVWAISTTANSVKCSPDEALSAALFIRRVLAKLYSRFFSDQITIIYGGSVDSKNITDYIFKAGLAGALVGAASLKAEEFVKIVENLK